MHRPLRFLQVTTFYPPYSFGGDAVYVERLSHALAGRGHRVEVVHNLDAYRQLAPRPHASAEERHTHIRRHALSSAWPLLSLLVTHQSGQSWPYARSLQKIADEFQPDVIHYHNISLLGAGVLRLAPRRGPKPVKLYTTHDHWLHCPTHVLWKFNREPCAERQCLRCVVHARRPPQWWRHTSLIARSARHVDAFLSPSRFAIRMHRERGFSAPLRHFPSFAPRANGDAKFPGPRPHAAPYFLYVGRLEAIKGLDALILAWPGVPQADLVVVGGGREERRLREQAASDPRIRFAGPQDAVALDRFYAHALACIVPSSGFEVFPLVVVEAFAHRVPVIARDLGGLSEMIADSGGGLLFRDTPGLYDALRTIQAEPERARALGEAGYQWFVENGNAEIHTARYLRLIEQIAAQREETAHA
jgi:glycosyltransferase involved in cell wall biosynthesis